MADRRAQYHFSEYKTPMDKEYHPELAETPLLDAEFQTRYISMIGSLNWLISLGRFDVQYCTTTLARYSNGPREGHLKAVLRVLGYVKKFIKGKLLIDPTLPEHELFLMTISIIGMTYTQMPLLKHHLMLQPQEATP